MCRGACAAALAVGLLLGATPAWAESWVLWSNHLPFSTGPLSGWHTDRGSFASQEACFAEMSWMAHSFVSETTRTARELRKVDPDNYVRTWDVRRTGNRTTAVGTAPAGVQTENRKLVLYWECAPAGVTPR